MAQAMATSWRALPNVTLSASAPSLAPGADANGVLLYSDNLAHVGACDVLVLAVKPPQAPMVLQQIGAHLKPGSVLVSIVAGLPLSTLDRYRLPEQACIRCMPNLPMAYGVGATPLLANARVSAEQKRFVQQLFAHVGCVAWVEDDAQMDCYTALSGSGPAYVLYFLESMLQAGHDLGLPEASVRAFVLQTMRGGLALLEHSAQSPETLRQQITSPGGTTEAAMAVLQTQAFKSIVCDAVKAAYQRARVLSGLDVGNENCILSQSPGFESEP